MAQKKLPTKKTPKAAKARASDKKAPEISIMNSLPQGPALDGNGIPIRTGPRIYSGRYSGHMAIAGGVVLGPGVSSAEAAECARDLDR